MLLSFQKWGQKSQDSRYFLQASSALLRPKIRFGTLAPLQPDTPSVLALLCSKWCGITQTARNSFAVRSHSWYCQENSSPPRQFSPFPSLPPVFHRLDRLPVSSMQKGEPLVRV